MGEAVSPFLYDPWSASAQRAVLQSLRGRYLPGGSRPHTGEQKQAHVPLCTVSTDRLQMVAFMPWGYIKDISPHVLKTFDPRSPEPPGLEEVFETIYFE